MKNALLTGASEGIGRAIAKKLAKEDFKLTLVARNKERLDTLLQELGQGHRIVVADLSKPEEYVKLTELFSKEHFDLLVNNAGAGLYGQFSELPLDKLMGIFRLNMESVFVLSHEFLKHAKAGDALVNVSSTLAFFPLSFAATYSGTKSFVTAFSEAVWYEEKNRDVYVMNLCPGLTRTEFSNRAGGRTKSPPDAMYQSAEEVAEEMWNALVKRSQPTVITGRRNQTLALISRLFSRKNIVKILGVTR